MRLSSALKLAAVLLALLTVGLVAAVKSMDMDRAKALLTAQIHAATGRTLTIGGPLELRLGLIPRVVATDLTLSNPPGATRPSMVSVERIEAEIALLPLLKREIQIKRLIVSAPDILMETEAKGPGNLNFTPAAKTGAPTPTPADGIPAYRFTLREIKIKNGSLAWHDRTSRQTEKIELHTFSVLPEPTPGGMLAVRVVGMVRERLVEITGAVGGPDIPAGKPWPLHLKLGTDGAVLTAEGNLAEPLALRGIDLKLAVTGEDLGAMARWTGLAATGTPLPLGPFKLAGHLSDAAGPLGVTELDAAVGKRDSLLLSAKGAVKDVRKPAGIDLTVAMESDNLAGLSPLVGTDIPSMGPVRLGGVLRGGGDAWTLSEMKASLAGSDIAGDLALNLARQPRLSGHLNAGTLALDDFLTPAAKPGEKPAPKAVKPAGSDGRLFSAAPLPIQSLRGFDLDLNVRAAKFSTGETALTDVTAEMHLTGGRLTVKPFQASLAGGTLGGEASLDASAKVPTAALRLNAQQVELGRLAGKALLSGGKSDLKIDVTGRGDSVRALMASASGETVLRVGEGRLQNKAVDWVGGDALFQIVGALNPMAKSEDTTQLSCAVARFTLRDGIATANKGLAMRTAKTDVVGSGTVDLRTETLDIGIRPKARDGVGLSLSAPLADFTRLRGTLSNPSIGIDQEGGVRAAASMGAAMATGGLSLLGELLLDKVSADSDPCRTALAQTPAKSKGKAKPGFIDGLFGR